MNVQEIIVAVLVLICLGIVLRKIFLFFKHAEENDNPCANCSSGCDLRQMMDEKKQQCRKESTQKKKNCCG